MEQYVARRRAWARRSKSQTKALARHCLALQTGSFSRNPVRHWQRSSFIYGIEKLPLLNTFFWQNYCHSQFYLSQQCSSSVTVILILYSNAHSFFPHCVAVIFHPLDPSFSVANAVRTWRYAMPRNSRFTCIPMPKDSSWQTLYT